jgi:MFS transporter, DHA1 family, inner membrane transport protein
MGFSLPQLFILTFAANINICAAMTFKEKLLILILALVNFTHIMDFMIMMPLGTFLMPLFNINPQEFSWIVSVYSISAGISGFIAAFFVDRFNRKNVLLFGYSGFILGTFGCALAPGYISLLLARTFAGAFGGLIGAQVLAIVGDTFPYEKRGTVMGAIMTAFSAASVIGVPAGLYFAAEYSWHSPFIAIVALGIIIIVLIFKYVPDMNSHKVEKKVREKPLMLINNILANRNLLTGLTLSVVMMLGHFVVIPFFAPYMSSNVGFTEHQISYIYLVGGILTIFTGPLIGKMADKTGKLKTLTIFLLLSLIPILIITHMQATPIYLALVITGLFFVFAGGRMIPGQAMLTSIAEPKLRGGFMGVNSSIQQLMAGFASLLAGAIIVKSPTGILMNYDLIGYIAVAFSILAIFVARKLVLPNSKPVTDKPIEIISLEEELA